MTGTRQLGFEDSELEQLDPALRQIQCVVDAKRRLETLEGITIAFERQERFTSTGKGRSIVTGLLEHLIETLHRVFEVLGRKLDKPETRLRRIEPRGFLEHGFELALRRAWIARLQPLPGEIVSGGHSGGT